MDALEELEFNVDHIHNIVHIIQTITSSALRVITLNPKGNYPNPLDTWNKLDAELCTLARRIGSAARRPWDDNSSLQVKLFLKSNNPDYDFVELASRLLPRYIRGGSLAVLGSFVGDFRMDYQFPVYLRNTLKV